MTDVELANKIGEALAQGHFVHLIGYPSQPSPRKVKMTADSIFENFAIHENDEVSALGELPVA